MFMGLEVGPLVPIMAHLTELELLEVGRTDDACWYPSLAEGAPV
jgi:hypothetical protein